MVVDDVALSRMVALWAVGHLYRDQGPGQTSEVTLRFLPGEMSGQWCHLPRRASWQQEDSLVGEVQVHVES